MATADKRVVGWLFLVALGTSLGIGTGAAVDSTGGHPAAAEETSARPHERGIREAQGTPIAANTGPAETQIADSHSRRLVLAAGTETVAEPDLAVASFPSDQPDRRNSHTHFVGLPVIPDRPPPRTDRSTNTRVRIAVVIDDLGLNRRLTRKAIALPAPITLSFLSYAPALDIQTERAAVAGHELLLHLPMEPLSAYADPGPSPLRLGLAPEELRRRLHHHLTAFDGYVGVNNHMGSRFTANAEVMQMVLAVLKAGDLFFLDSLTTADSVGVSLARKLGVRHAVRDVFLDTDRRDAAIKRQLAKLETRARRRGYAIAIGHPYEATLRQLSTWLAEARTKAFQVVPLSHLVDRGSPHTVAHPQRSQGTAGLD